MYIIVYKVFENVINNYYQTRFVKILNVVDEQFTVETIKIIVGYCQWVVQIPRPSP